MDKLKYHILAILACLGWGSAFAFIKLGLEYAPTFQLSGMRFMLAGIILLPFLLKKDENWSILLKEWKFILLFSIFQVFGQYAFYFSGMNLVPASVAAIIVGASPLVVFVLAHFFLKNDKFTPSKMISVALGVLGVVVMSLKNSDSSGSNPYYLLGVIFIISSVTINSAVNIVVAKNSRPISPIMLTAVSNFLGGVMLFTVSPFTEEMVSLSEFDTRFWFILLALAVISSAGFSIWFYLLKLPNMKVSEINIWKFITPVFGVILSWIVFADDNPDTLSIIGIISITTAIIVLQVGSFKQKKAK